MKKYLHEKVFKNKDFVSGVISGVVALVVILIIAFVAQAMFSGNLPQDKAGLKATNYINNTLLQGQGSVKINEISSATSELYKIIFDLNGQPITSYMTKNGKLLFPESFDISTSTIGTSTPEASEKPQANNAGVKSDKPVVELFVMSYCPYGTQIEKGIIPAVKALGDKIDFKLKFVDYAMHGQSELTENTVQYCIDKGQNSKLFPYLTCFLKAGDSAGCVKSTGVDQAALNSCVKSTDAEFKITAQFTGKQNWKGSFPPFDVHKSDNAKYEVQGSPTLVINGAQANAGRDSASLLKAMCDGFNTAPEVCKTAKLSSASPAPGFGDGVANSGAPASGCATN